MRIALIAVAVALCGGAALADTAARTESATAAPTAARQVYVCDSSGETRRSWVLEHGGMTFVSAEELARAEANKETWSTPRCITAAELQRFEKSNQTVKVVRISD